MTPPPSNSPTGPVRRSLATFLSLVTTLVWTHGLAAVVRAFQGLPAEELAGASLALTVGALGTAAAGSLALTTPGGAARRAGFAGLIAAALIGWSFPGTLPMALVLVPVGSTIAALGQVLARRLPQSLEGQSAPRPRQVALWCLVAAVALFQFGRLSTYVTDRSSDWFLTTRNPFYAKHECANAYVFAAELSRRGEDNVYAAHHYPGIDNEAAPESEIAGIVPEDPFQYPPQFLLLPRLAIEATADYGVIRSCWFALNTTLCLLAVLALASWVGGRTGRIACALTPALMASFPVLHNLQYGQFHFAAIALTVLGLIAFQSQRTRTGGLLVASAVLAKMFPAIVLVPLAIQKRWRELGWTLGAGTAITALALAVLGTAPFEAFFSYHLPRLSDGSAFAFGEAWPEVADLLLAGNQGVAGVLQKMEALGLVASSAEWVQGVGRLFGLLLLALAALTGRGLRDASRAQHARSWLALLGLASLASAGAWADYVPLTCVWLLLFLAPLARGKRWMQVALGFCAFMQVTLFGTLPIGEASGAEWMMPISLIGALTMLVTFLAASAPPFRRRAVQEENRPEATSLISGGVSLES